MIGIPGYWQLAAVWVALSFAACAAIALVLNALNEDDET